MIGTVHLPLIILYQYFWLHLDHSWPDSCFKVTMSHPQESGWQLTDICHSYTDTCHSYTDTCHSYTDTCHSYTDTCHSYTDTCHSYTDTCHSYTDTCHSYTDTCHSYTVDKWNNPLDLILKASRNSKDGIRTNIFNCKMMINYNKHS